MMKRLFLTSVAALFLATGTAHAEEWPATTDVEKLEWRIIYATTCPVSGDEKFAEWYEKWLRKLNDLALNYPEDQRLAADQKIKKFIQQITQTRFCEIASERIWGR